MSAEKGALLPRLASHLYLKSHGNRWSRRCREMLSPMDAVAAKGRDTLRSCSDRKGSRIYTLCVLTWRGWVNGTTNSTEMSLEGKRSVKPQNKGALGRKQNSWGIRWLFRVRRSCHVRTSVRSSLRPVTANTLPA